LKFAGVVVPQHGCSKPLLLLHTRSPIREAVVQTHILIHIHMQTHTDTYADNAQVEVGKVDTAKFDDAYFKSADKKKGASKKTEGEFFNEVRRG